MDDPDQRNVLFTGTFLEQTVHTVQRFAGHVLPENDHIGVEHFNGLPQLIQQDLVSAVCTVAHDHVLGQPCHVIVRDLTILRCIFFPDHTGGDHGEHIGQRHNAPAVEQPYKEVHIVMRLYTPDNCPVAIFLRSHLFLLIGLLRQF